MDRPERTVNLITDTNALTEFGKALDRVLLERLVDADSLPRIPQKDVLTNREAMEYLGLSRPTLARLRRDGRLPYYKVGKSVFYRRDDIAEMIRRGRVVLGGD